MSKSAPKAPTPVDPNAVAAATTKSNIGTAAAQSALNQVNSSNPFGSTTYQQTGTTNIDGNLVPTYSKNTSLSAPLSSLLSSIEAGANSTKYGTAGLPNGGVIQDPTLLNQSTSDALYKQATSRLDPQWAQTQAQMEAKLQQQGIPPGSAAYGQAMDNFNRAKNDAYTSAQNAATQYGVQDAATLYNEGLAGLNAGMQEQQQPLSLLSQIMSGVNGTTATSTPQSSISPTDTMSAYQLQAQQQQNAYNQQLQQYNSALGGLGSLAGNALMYALL